jgi:hypothetical protein
MNIKADNYVNKIANRARVKRVYSVGDHFPDLFRKLIITVLTQLCPFMKKSVPNTAAQTKIREEIIQQPQVCYFLAVTTCLNV